MTAVDLWACAAAAVASAAIGLRYNLLKREAETFVDGPAPVRVALCCMALAMGYAMVSCFWSGATTEREALVYTILAAASLVLLWNLHRQSREGSCARPNATDEPSPEGQRPNPTPIHKE